MSSESNRQSIVSAIEEAKAAWMAYALLIEYDNREFVDLASQVNPYLMVDIVYLNGDQLDLGVQPLVVDSGVIVLAAGVKAGVGSASLMKLLDHMRGFLQLRDNIGNVRTRAAKIQKYFRANGFFYVPMLVPFWTIEVAPADPPALLTEDGQQILTEGGDRIVLG